MYNIISTFPFNLAYEIIGNEEEALQTNQYNLMRLLDSLTEREKNVLLLRFKDRKTLLAVGELLGVSKERVRQIEVRALRKLRHPARLSKIKSITIDEHKKILEDIMKIEDENYRITNKYNELVKAIQSGGVLNITEKEKVANTREINIEDLGLSVRAYNCLHRKDIKNLKDLTEISIDELFNIRNIGIKTANEIIYTVESRGYRFKV